MFSTLLKKDVSISTARSTRLSLLIPIRPRLIQIGIHGGEEKPRVNWPLPEWDTAIAPRRARPRELPLICTYARLVLPPCLHERISLQTGIGRSEIQTITTGSLIGGTQRSPVGFSSIFPAIFPYFASTLFSLFIIGCIKGWKIIDAEVTYLKKA